MSDLDVSLVKISEADRMLIEAKSVEDCISVADIAEAARAYAKRVGASIPLLNRVVSLKLRAERKAGDMIAQNGRPLRWSQILRSVCQLGNRSRS